MQRDPVGIGTGSRRPLRRGKRLGGSQNDFPRDRIRTRPNRISVAGEYDINRTPRERQRIEVIMTRSDENSQNHEQVPACVVGNFMSGCSFENEFTILPPMAEVTRLVANPKNNLPLFSVQLLTILCGCFCILVGGVCFVVSQTPKDYYPVYPTIDNSAYEEHVYEIYYQEKQIINGTTSSTHPFQAALLPQEDGVASLRMCFLSRDASVTGDGQAVVPYPQYPSENGLLIGSCPPGDFDASSIPAVPICTQPMVYVDVNSTHVVPTEFSLLILMDTCYADEDCSCDGLLYLLDGYIIVAFLILFTVVGLVLLCCCFCGCGICCCGCGVLLSIKAYQDSAPYDMIHINEPYKL